MRLEKAVERLGGGGGGWWAGGAGQHLDGGWVGGFPKQGMESQVGMTQGGGRLGPEVTQILNSLEGPALSG